MTDRKVALVFGASGIIGRGFLKHLDGLNDWDIIGVMRSPPDFETRAEHLSIDLTDRGASLSALKNLPQVTHAFYTAYKDYPTWEEAAEPNTGMFKNAMDGLLQNAPNLEHIHILQGAKYYGRHLGPYKTPSKEDDPRHMPPSLYYGQEDYLREIQVGQTLELVGGTSASRMRILHRQPTEPHVGRGRLRRHIQRTGPASTLAWQVRRVWHHLSGDR